MSANEYYRRFTNLSRYDEEIAANPAKMIYRFKMGTKKKWRTMTVITPCETYQDFYEILLRVEDSENMPSDSEEEGKEGNQRRDDKGKGQSFHGPRKTQSFKKSGTSSSSSSEGFSATGQRRGGRFTRGTRFQRQRDLGGSGASLCRRCNNRHFGECRRGSSECYTCGQMGHLAMYCPQSQQRPQQPSLPPPVPTQQFSGPSGYAQTGRGSTYHFQGDSVPYPSGQYQYAQDPYQQSGYGQYSGGYMPYQQNGFGQHFSTDGSQWQSGRQPQQVDIAASSVGSSRQHTQSGQGRSSQGRGVHASRGRGGRQQNQGRINNISLHDAQNNPDLIMGMLNILGYHAKVLINCGATHSVIFHTFAQMTQPQSTPLGYELEFAMPRGERCYVDSVYPGCPVMVDDVVMPADLTPLDIVDFDVILGTYWLHYNRANIDCYGKTVTFHRPGLPKVTFVGEPSGVRHGVISAVRAKKLLSKGCQVYLAHVVLNDEIPSSMENVRVVRHFQDVFPEDLLGLPPDRDVEFTIDLLLGTDPISLTLYRMAPAELKELKIQLQELVDKGFI